MLPHLSSEENIPPVARMVYINPNFHSQIANSLQQSQGRPNNSSTQQSWDRPSIHINPHFLQRQQEYQMQLQLQQLQQQQHQQQLVTYYQQQTVAASAAAEVTPPPAKIISKASTCLVRKQPVKNIITTPTVRLQAPLVSISKRKLVRQGANIAKVATNGTPATTAVSATAIATAPPAKRTRYKLVRAISLTSSSCTPLVKKRRARDFVARYALRRTNESAVGKKLR